ncbi:MAG: peptidoglycan DD-metalloendopeptidase family protein [candidate division Zixibacteria bacterium]|nr:peptidoglycan DD-metalloendopeptidase family protein [candidate division Zixibacteria bacterium]
MNIKLIFYIFSALFIPLSLTSAGENYQFSPPIKGEIYLSSLFGDYRPGHFHAGVDMRTGGKPGRRLYAADDGYIWRVMTTFNGYGKALYLKTKSGHYFVHGHLQDFAPPVSKRVFNEQLKNQSYKTNLFFKPGEFPVKKGEFIGHTGQSGAGAPHLHYEVRSPDNKPVNPLTQNILIDDTRNPEIISIALVQFGERTDPGSVLSKEIYDCGYNNSTGEYEIEQPITVAGKFAFELNAYDRINHYNGNMGVFQISFYFDSQLIYRYRADTLEFDSFKQSDYVRDYELWYRSLGAHPDPKRIDKDRYSFYRLYLVPGDNQPTVKLCVGDGYFSSIPGRTSGFNKVSTGKHYVDIVLTDSNGNSSELSFTIDVVEKPPVNLRRPSPEFVSGAKPTDNGMTFLDGGIHVDLTPQKLYYPEKFWAREISEAPLVSGYHIIRQFELYPRFTFFKDNAAMSVELAPASSGKNYYCIGWQDIDGEYVFAGNDFNSDSSSVGCKIGATGRFAVVVDSIAPELELLRPRMGWKLKSGNGVTIQIKMEDNFSGLGSEDDLKFYLDGKWMPAEYDSDRDLIEFKAPFRLDKGKHTIMLKVSDQCGNESSLQSYFHVM